MEDDGSGEWCEIFLFLPTLFGASIQQDDWSLEVLTLSRPVYKVKQVFETCN